MVTVSKAVLQGLVVSILAFSPALAMDEVKLTIKGHQFMPSTLRIPAGTKVKLVVRNEDSADEEFESYDLNRVKIIRAGQQADVYVGPLSPGTYTFVGELHEETAKGTLIAE